VHSKPDSSGIKTITELTKNAQGERVKITTRVKVLKKWVSPRNKLSECNAN
jgi:hypothetical protein